MSTAVSFMIMVNLQQDLSQFNLMVTLVTTIIYIIDWAHELKKLQQLFLTTTIAAVK